MSKERFNKPGEQQRLEQTLKQEGLEIYMAEREPDDHDRDERDDDSHPYLTLTAEWADTTKSEDVNSLYTQYAIAMRRRDREPLSRERFISHFFENGSIDKTYMYGNPADGYLLGFKKYGIFIPTHFAPTGIKGGYRLFKELAESTDLPVVMAITPDLVATIRKMKGWHELGQSFQSRLGDETVEKEIVYNSHPLVVTLAQKIQGSGLESYILDQIVSSRTEEFGDRESNPSW